jgi:hypothetical protein
LSLGEKPRQQSIALQQNSEQASVGRISEEMPEGPEGKNPPPGPPQKESRRNSLSLFFRRKSLERGNASEMTNGRWGLFSGAVDL